ncbi:hypothetical protein ACTFIW_003800 [Dictyostelium discoideum]
MVKKKFFQTNLSKDLIPHKLEYRNCGPSIITAVHGNNVTLDLVGYPKKQNELNKNQIIKEVDTDCEELVREYWNNVQKKKLNSRREIEMIQKINNDSMKVITLLHDYIKKSTAKSLNKNIWTHRRFHSVNAQASLSRFLLSVSLSPMEIGVNNSPFLKRSRQRFHIGAGATLKKLNEIIKTWSFQWSATQSNMSSNRREMLALLMTYQVQCLYAIWRNKHKLQSLN